jgi:hypothetical protein
MKRDIPLELIQRDFGLVFAPFAAPLPRVLITVQHCGLSKNVFRGIYQERDSDAVSESGVLSLAMDIFRQASPHVGIIYNQFHRIFLETNVPPEEGYSDPAMKKYYDSYHREIDQYLISASAAVQGPCLLLDLHGFTGQPPYAPEPTGYDVILGTGNRETVLCKRHDTSPNMTNLDRQLRDVLEKEGLSVFCPEREPILEKRWRDRVVKLEPPSLPDHYNGGYLIHHHARDCHLVAAAIQIEVAPTLRERSAEMTNEGRRKNSGFVTAISALVKDVCT